MKQLTTLCKKANRKSAKKELSIHEIAPNWSRVLPLTPVTEQQEFYKANIKLDISDAKWCIVGEAYGFEEKYFDSNNKEFCRDCFSHSVNFGALLMEKPVNREQPLNAFVEHWNNTHV